MKKVVLSVALLALSLCAVHSADAQSGGRGRSSFAGAGSNPDGRVLAQRTGGIPRFCYDRGTGQFTHWGPCRVVCTPMGCTKVAH